MLKQNICFSLATKLGCQTSVMGSEADFLNRVNTCQTDQPKKKKKKNYSRWVIWAKDFVFQFCIPAIACDGSKSILVGKHLFNNVHDRKVLNMKWFYYGSEWMKWNKPLPKDILHKYWIFKDSTSNIPRNMWIHMCVKIAWPRWF